MDADTFIAICALGISLIATSFMIYSAALERKHMRLSVKPIATIPVADYENKVAVYLENKGLGPMRIKSLYISKKKGETFSNIISHMPKLEEGIHWTDFYEDVNGATLQNGERFKLIKLEGCEDDAMFIKSRDSVRLNLRDLTVSVEYEDLYGTEMPAVQRELSWFGRHFK